MKSSEYDDIAGGLPAGNNQGAHGGDSGPVRVWLVDDSRNFRSLVAELLDSEQGFECSRQFSSAEAVLDALMREKPPDVILLDIEMGRLSGLEAIRPIKSIANSTHVLMLTSYSDSFTKMQALRNGAADFLSKSRDVIDISQHIRNVLDRETAPAPMNDGNIQAFTG